MELKRVEGIELSTLDRYQDILDNRLVPYFGHMKIRDISGSMLNCFYREMLQPGQNKKTGGSLSRKTVLEFHRLLSTILRRQRSCTLSHAILPRMLHRQKPPNPHRLITSLQSLLKSRLPLMQNPPNGGCLAIFV